jgi:ELWxxDGT repeat protein
LTALLPASPGPPVLWRTDGTAAGTRILLPNAASTLETARLGGATYFLNDGGPGANLWTTDGTAAGTRPIVPEAAPAALVNARGLTVFDGALYFFAGGYPVNGPEHPPQALWRSDGTPAGTRIVKTIDPPREDQAPGGLLWPLLTVAGGHLFFRAEDAAHGAELWTTDGTAEGTVMVEDLFPGPAPSNPEQLTAADGLLYFTAHDGLHGREPWVLPLPR